MFLPCSIYGDYFLSGKIPGPNAIITPNETSTNVVTLMNINNCTNLPMLEDNKCVNNKNLLAVSKDLNSYESPSIRVNNSQDEMNINHSNNNNNVNTSIKNCKSKNFSKSSSKFQHKYCKTSENFVEKMI